MIYLLHYLKMYVVFRQVRTLNLHLFGRFQDNLKNEMDGLMLPCVLQDQI